MVRLSDVVKWRLDVWLFQGAVCFWALNTTRLNKVDFIFICSTTATVVAYFFLSVVAVYLF